MTEWEPCHSSRQAAGEPQLCEEGARVCSPQPPSAAPAQAGQGRAGGATTGHTDRPEGASSVMKPAPAGWSVVGGEAPAPSRQARQTRLSPAKQGRSRRRRPRRVPRTGLSGFAARGETREAQNVRPGRPLIFRTWAASSPQGSRLIVQIRDRVRWPLMSQYSSFCLFVPRRTVG